jgi:peroxiredoxin
MPPAGGPKCPPAGIALAAALQGAAATARREREPVVTAGLDAAIAALHRAGLTEAALQRGETAPEFDLPSAGGPWISLEDLLSAGVTVVTFFRGAWCPYCNLTLHGLQALLPEIRAAGGEVVAISPQPADMALAQTERQKLGFALLHDGHNQVGRLYGLVYPLPRAWIAHYRSLGIDIARLNGTARWELPLAATYVIGRDGTAAYASIEVDPTRRFDPQAVIRSVRQGR